MVLNPFLIRVTRTMGIPGALVTIVLWSILTLIAYQNGGLDASFVLSILPIPLIAAILVSRPFGHAVTGLLVGEFVVFYILQRSGYPFPQPLSREKITLFTASELLSIFPFLALASWQYRIVFRRAFGDLEGRFVQRVKEFVQASAGIRLNLTWRKQAEDESGRLLLAEKRQRLLSLSWAKPVWRSTPNWNSQDCLTLCAKKRCQSSALKGSSCGFSKGMNS